MELQVLQEKIVTLRGIKVMLDFDLAQLYEVETRVLKQSIRRNSFRFPIDFMFELTKKEWSEVITNCDNLPENIKYSPKPPFAFTEQGVAMLSSVLKSVIISFQSLSDNFVGVGLSLPFLSLETVTIWF